MFSRELKVNLKSFLMWFSIIGIFFFIILAAYPFIINTENMNYLDEMMAMFPEELLKAFNLDIASISTAFGWFKSEGFVFILLVIGCYSGLIGINILLKEESDLTIEYLNSLPIKRTNIVLEKSLVGIIYIVLLVLGLSILNLLGLLFENELNLKQYILLSITPLFSSLVIYFMCLFISTFTHKTKKMIGVGLGIVFISYILNILSQISDSVSFLKYASVFTLSDIRNVIINVSINPLMIIISIFLSIIFLLLTIYRYNKKELV